MDGRMWLDAALMMPVAAGGARVGIPAGGEPLLGEVPEPQIVGCTRSAHPRRHPPRIDRVAEYVRPCPRDGGGERGDEELAVWIRPGRPAAPVDAGQPGSP